MILGETGAAVGTAGIGGTTGETIGETTVEGVGETTVGIGVA